MFALSQHGSARANQALRAYAERPDLPVDLREKAIFWIGQSGGAENEAYLRGSTAGSRRSRCARRCCSRSRRPAARRTSAGCSGSRKDGRQPLELRKQALFWAGQSDASMTDLTALYAAMPDREMREQLIFVYSQRDEPAAVDKLLDIAQREPDPELRKKALFWLGQSDDPRAAKALQDIIEQP